MMAEDHHYLSGMTDSAHVKTAVAAFKQFDPDGATWAVAGFAVDQQTDLLAHKLGRPYTDA